MDQRTSYLYSLVTVPKFYSSFQAVLGADRSRKAFIEMFVRPDPGIKILDVGCGPATLLSYLGKVDYTGFDLNPRHIDHAQRAFAGQGRFICGNAATGLEVLDESFDIAVASGLLHHLSDDDARSLMLCLARLVRPGGKVCTIDPVWVPRQRPVAFALKKLDSGKHIRTADAYLSLAQGQPFVASSQTFRDWLRVPYDHFCMSLKRV